MELYRITQIGFAILTFGFYGLLLRELKTALPKTSFTAQKQKQIFTKALFGLIVWMLITSILSISDFIKDFSTFPPRQFIMLIVPLIVIVWLTFSKTVKEILPHIPQQNIIRLQVFRVFVEILLWMLFIDNLLPIQMTFEGRNFDILAGLTAPVIAWLISTHRISKAGIITWNMLSLGLLINIVSVAMLSMPLPFRYFMNEPSNTIVTEFPIIWLPSLFTKTTCTPEIEP